MKTFLSLFSLALGAGALLISGQTSSAQETLEYQYVEVASGSTTGTPNNHTSGDILVQNGVVQSGTFDALGFLQFSFTGGRFSENMITTQESPAPVGIWYMTMEPFGAPGAASPQEVILQAEDAGPYYDYGYWVAVTVPEPSTISLFALSLAALLKAKKLRSAA